MNLLPADADADAEAGPTDPADPHRDDAAVADAGPFGAWLERTLALLRGQGEADVPCGTCTGCCTSSYYIRIRPRDRPAVAAFAQSYLVTPPGITPGDALMGWRHDGTCPALESGSCTIYAHRPMTCRDYDCRVFAVAGIDAGDERKAVINARVRAWRFSFADDAERRAFAAIRRAAGFIRRHGDRFPAGFAPTAPTGIAVLAMKIYPVFMAEDPDADPDTQAREALAAARAFDRAPPAQAPPSRPSGPIAST
jgi:hypothetical protein